MILCAQDQYLNKTDTMERANEGNLLEIIDLAHSLRQEHLYITSEQQMFLNLNETLNKNAANVAQVTHYFNSYLSFKERNNNRRRIPYSWPGSAPNSDRI